MSLTVQKLYFFNLLYRKFFLDAIPMTGTVDALRMMTQLLISREVSGIEADMWLTTLAFTQHPTLDMLAEVKVLVGILL